MKPNRYGFDSTHFPLYSASALMSNCKRGNGSDSKTLKQLVSKLSLINETYPDSHDIVVSTSNGQIILSVIGKDIPQMGDVVSKLIAAYSPMSQLFHHEPTILHIQGKNKLFSLYEAGDYVRYCIPLFLVGCLLYTPPSSSGQRPGCQTSHISLCVG